MIFYNDPFIASLAEEHAASVSKLNDSETDRVIDAYDSVSRKLNQRLIVLRNQGKGDTFTAQKMRSTLVQVDAALKKIGDNLQTSMGNSVQVLAESGVQDLVDELTAWDTYFAGAAAPLNIDISEAASDAADLLVNNYEVSIAKWQSGQRAIFAQALSDGVIGGANTDEIILNLMTQIESVQWQLRRVVRTELQGIYSRSKLKVMGSLVDDDTIPDLLKTVWNPMDSRTAEDSKQVQKMVDAHNDGLIVPVDEYFHYRWRGVERRYLAPPDRPNDRSIMVPYRKSWDSKYRD